MSEEHKRLMLSVVLTLALILVAFSAALPPSPDECGIETRALHGGCTPPPR